MSNVTCSLANCEPKTLPTAMEAELVLTEEKLKIALDIMENLKKENEVLK